MSIYKKRVNWGGIDLDCDIEILTNVLKNINNIRKSKFVPWKLWKNITYINFIKKLNKKIINPHLASKVIFDNINYLNTLKIKLNNKDYYRFAKKKEQFIIKKYFKKSIKKKTNKIVYWLSPFWEIKGMIDVLEKDKIIEIKYIRGKEESKNQLIIERAILQLAFYKLNYKHNKKDAYLGLIDLNNNLYLFKINNYILRRVLKEFFKRIKEII